MKNNFTWETLAGRDRGIERDSRVRVGEREIEVHKRERERERERDPKVRNWIKRERG